jgi:hypothetical protein
MEKAFFFGPVLTHGTIRLRPQAARLALAFCQVSLPPQAKFNIYKKITYISNGFKVILKICVIKNPRLFRDGDQINLIYPSMRFAYSGLIQLRLHHALSR